MIRIISLQSECSEINTSVNYTTSTDKHVYCAKESRTKSQ